MKFENLALSANEPDAAKRFTAEQDSDSKTDSKIEDTTGSNTGKAFENQEKILIKFDFANTTQYYQADMTTSEDSKRKQMIMDSIGILEPIAQEHNLEYRSDVYVGSNPAAATRHNNSFQQQIENNAAAIFKYY